MRRESEKEFNQRMRITQHITKTVFQNLIKPSYKIPRSNGALRILEYTNDTESKKKLEFEGILDGFYGDESYDSYLETQYINNSHIDPNAFLVIEWEDFDNNNERAQPYPFEVSSKEAIYFEYKQNKLQELVVEQIVNDITDGLVNEIENRSVHVYTMYMKDGAIKLTEVIDPDIIGLVGKETMIGEDLYISTQSGVFKVEEAVYTLGKVPAKRIGYKRDTVTANRTFVSSLDDAIPIMMKIVMVNSELDLTMKLHAFPQKIQRVPKCTADGCNRGRLPSGDICGVCKGEGTSVVSSTQEAIELPMPKDKEEAIALSDIIRYEKPDVAIIENQQKYVDYLTVKCKDAVFNSDIFSRKEIAETATGKNIDLENAYDTLYPEAKAYSSMWEFGIYISSKVTDLDKDLIFKYTFSRDLKMKGMSQLLMDLKTAVDSRADGFVKAGIQMDIARLMYIDNPEELERFKTRQFFFPYSGKTKEEIMFIVANLPAKDPVKVLWESYGWIFDDIALEQSKNGKNFYEFRLSVQKKLLDKKIKSIIEAMPDEPVLIKPDEDVE